ncbi:MAG: hypothetical protein CM1200mP26_27170 [Acidimicrobiales bacterium]|nr:MAG: hypothetical protein CM1200mP26_27170 [Acidimicrobiales bacterium]
MTTAAYWITGRSAAPRCRGPSTHPGQTGQQLLLGAYSALMRQVAAGTVELHSRSELLEVVKKDGRACGIVTRDLISGEVVPHSAHAVVLATGGYGNVYFLSTNAMMCNVTAAWRAHKKGAFFANPCYTQIHPTCIPVSDDFQSKLTLMSESLRNDGRIWVPDAHDDARIAADIPEAERDYYLERKYPAFGNLVPRDVASRNAKTVCDEGRGVGPLKNGVFLDFAAAIARDGVDAISAKYGNLFDMYHRITGENPYEQPMRIYPAIHYTMGGLWVDYHLMTSVPGLYAIGEANFSDHGANRLGASALMQGLADGYFVLPYTIGDDLAGLLGQPAVPTDDPVFTEAVADVNDEQNRWLSINGTKSVDHYHRELGRIVWEYIGMGRTEAGLTQALSEIPALRDEFHSNVRVLGSADTLNQSLEKAGRVADFFELAELMARDALEREESCGGHFREEHQTAEGEAQRDDENFAHVAAWEWNGEGTAQTRHREELTFENVALAQRSYK